MVSVNIRPMTEDDKPGLMNILRHTPEFMPSEVPVAEEVIDAYLRAPGMSGYYIKVAENESGLAGYICYGPTPLTEGTWDIYWEAVARKNRGQGIGSALMESAEIDIRQSRGRLSVIETSSKPEYEKTRRFFIRHGYEVIARIPDFYAPGDDRIIFLKRLG